MWWGSATTVPFQIKAGESAELSIGTAFTGSSTFITGSLPFIVQPGQSELDTPGFIIRLVYSISANKVQGIAGTLVNSTEADIMETVTVSGNGTPFSYAGLSANAKDFLEGLGGTPLYFNVIGSGNPNMGGSVGSVVIIPETSSGALAIGTVALLAVRRRRG